ncbi:Cytochrome P450 [Mycena kentingensis (nom. inval.)]|nr:Cytochrome P450 [Mycena kentingensis (nom. inval.)]
MVALAPGPKLLAHLAVQLLSKPVVLGLLLHHGSRRLTPGNAIPVWGTVLVCVASIPLYVAFRIRSRDRKQAADAKAMGARLIPRVQGRWPGNLDVMLRTMKSSLHGYPGQTMSEFVEELGPVINISMFWTDHILTISPDHIKRILATDFDNFPKGPGFSNIASSVLGTGVFIADGDMWKFHRTLTRPFFTRDRISHFDKVDAHATRVIAHIKVRARSGYAVDFQDLIGRFTMDSATEMLFGTCTDSLKTQELPYPHNAPPRLADTTADESTAAKFVAAFAAAMDVVARRRGRDQLWPLWEMRADASVEPMRVVGAFLDPIIQAAIDRKKVQGGAAEDEQSTLLDELTSSTSDPKILKDETLNILLAGRDTTMHTLTMVIYFLSIHPEYCDRLRAEILERVGSTRRPDYDDIKEMKFLRAVINEALRLYPPVSFNIRQSLEATIWPAAPGDPDQTPVFVPAGTDCVYSVMMMQRRKDLWGPDADEFDPNRFLDERLHRYLVSNPFQFLPFNAGPRICLGQQFAYNEMSFMLVRLLQNFSGFRLDEEAWAPETRPPANWKNETGRRRIEKFKPKVHLTMYSVGGMWVKPVEA